MAKNYGAVRGLQRFEGFTDAVFAIALTLLIVEIKPPGAPDGTHTYTSLSHAMAEQWREHLALLLCYVTIGAYWLQHHYTGRIYARSDHVFGLINLLFLLAIVAIPYPIRVWCFHVGTPFEPTASVTLTAGLALIAVAWMMKWFYGMSGGRRVMDERLAPDFLKQMTRRYRNRDTDPDRGGGGGACGAADRRGDRRADRRLVPPSAAHPALSAGTGAGPGRERGGVAAYFASSGTGES